MRLVVELPGHAIETAGTEGGELLEGSGGKVEVVLGAADAAVGDGHRNLLATVWKIKIKHSMRCDGI